MWYNQFIITNFLHMSKEDKIVEMIGEVAVQATQQVLDFEQRLGARIEGVDSKVDSLGRKIDFLDKKVNALDEKIDKVEESLQDEMREIRNENANFHDEIVGYLKRAEQEHVFTSEHLRRHDEQIAELQRRR